MATVCKTTHILKNTCSNIYFVYIASMHMTVLSNNMNFVNYEATLKTDSTKSLKLCLIVIYQYLKSVHCGFVH